MSTVPMPAILSLSAALAVFPLPAPLAFAQNDTLGVPPMTSNNGFGTAPPIETDTPNASIPGAGQTDAPAQASTRSAGQAGESTRAAGSQ